MCKIKLFNSYITGNVLSKGEKTGLMVALVFFFVGIVPLIIKLIYKHWKKSHQMTPPSPPQNANLNQAFNNNGDTSQTTEFPIQILRDAELSSGKLYLHSNQNQMIDKMSSLKIF